VALEVLLAASGRQQIVAAMKLGDARNKIAEILGELDAILRKGGQTSP
jgi:tRNA threonylcarbamoyladenosine modification (KEOPS) complex Cgi121 subunit